MQSKIPMNDWSGTYRFYVKDHLGSNRMVADNPSTMVSYYPYGGIYYDDFRFYQADDNHLYNGKEMDRMYGLDWLDYGARMDNPAIGLWTQMDPLAEKYYHINPYLYCAGNPIRFIDPDGRRVVNEKGYNMIYCDNKKNIRYTSYTIEDVKTMVKCLSLTPTGKKMLKQLINSSIKVHFSISNETIKENGKITAGETIQGNMSKEKQYGKTADGKGITEATITISKGSIEETVQNKSGTKHAGLTVEQAIGAVIGHEIVHGTDKAQIAEDLQYEKNHNGKVNPNCEKKPNEIEQQIIEESKKNK